MKSSPAHPLPGSLTETQQNREDAPPWLGVWPEGESCQQKHPWVQHPQPFPRNLDFHGVFSWDLCPVLPVWSRTYLVSRQLENQA